MSSTVLKLLDEHNNKKIVFCPLKDLLLKEDA